MDEGVGPMREKRPPRDGLDPDTTVVLDCGHERTLYNNIHHDPSGWQTWCYECDRTRTVTSARPLRRYPLMDEKKDRKLSKWDPRLWLAIHRQGNSWWTVFRAVRSYP